MAAEATPELFSLTGVRPLAGRLLQPADESPGAPRVAVIDAGVWRRHFDARSEALGATLRLNGEPVTVVGVVPEDFAFPHSQRIWLNLRLDPATPRGEGAPVSVIGRLARGRSADAAKAELDAQRSESPVTLERFTASQADRRLRDAVAPMAVAVAAVLLVACANVASLLLARAVRRRRATAIRSALGAERWRLVVHDLGETAALTLPAAALGLLFAQLALRRFESLLAPSDWLRAFWMGLRLDPATLVGDDPTQTFAAIERRLVEVPGVDAVGWASHLPTQGSFFGEWTRVERPDEPFAARWLVVSEGFFAAADVPVLGGRAFDARDSFDAPGRVVVNRSFVDRFLGPGDPIGRRLRPAPSERQGAPDREYEIVGVVGDTVMGAVDDERDVAAVYLASTQRPSPAMAMLVAGREIVPEPESVREAVAGVDPGAVIFDAKPADSLLRARRWLYDLFTALFGLFGVVALALTLAGVYGVVALQARERSGEYGLRLALGATPRDLLVHVLRGGFLRVALGTVLGLGLAFGVARTLGSLLHGVSTWDPIVWIGSTALLLVAALAASLSPALEAARVDPLRSLG